MVDAGAKYAAGDSGIKNHILELFRDDKSAKWASSFGSQSSDETADAQSISQGWMSQYEVAKKACLDISDKVQKALLDAILEKLPSKYDYEPRNLALLSVAFLFVVDFSQ